MNRLRLSLFITVFTLFSSLQASAYEADYFSFRRFTPDATNFLDEKMNTEMDLAAQKVQSCSVTELQSALLESMGGGFGISKSEAWLDSVEGSAKTKPDSDWDIYGNLRMYRTCCAPLAKYKGHIISGDKIGHFIQSGFEMYVVAEKDIPQDALDPKAVNYAQYTKDIASSWDVPRGEGVKSVMATSKLQEDGNWGLTNTGVYSYADIAANYEGYLFWKELTTGKKPYYQCRDGRWKKIREFKWDKYITDAWDEGINCDDYVQGMFTTKVLRRITEALKKDKSTMATSCPVEPDKCNALHARYKGDTEGVLSPLCTKTSVKPKKSGQKKKTPQEGKK